MSNRHLVWDWNGTLLDDFALVIEATNATFASAGGPRISAEHHRQHFRRPIADYYAQVLDRPVGAEEFEQLNKVFPDAYQAALAGCELAAEAREALRSWPGSQSLLSMWYHSELVPMIHRYRLDGYFTRVDGLPYELSGAVDFKGPYLSRHLAAQDLDRALDLGRTSDQGVDAAFLRALAES
jgi:phosphoglycolate phosphatase-like HAD superfamily hydrolase